MYVKEPSIREESKGSLKDRSTNFVMIRPISITIEYRDM